MPKFPSLEWCRALAGALESDPEVAPAVADWGGRTVGVIISREAPLNRDFCVFAKPHPVEPRLVELRECEDEDDLRLEDPDFLFRAPYGTFRRLLSQQLDPVEVLVRGQVKVEGPLQRLLEFGRRHQTLSRRAIQALPRED